MYETHINIDIVHECPFIVLTIEQFYWNVFKVQILALELYFNFIWLLYF